MLNAMASPFCHLRRFGLHTGRINGISASLNSPLVITCGADKTVRVWDYTEWRCLIRHVLPEEPTDVSCHPSGEKRVEGKKRDVRDPTQHYPTYPTCQEEKRSTLK